MNSYYTFRPYMLVILKICVIFWLIWKNTIGVFNMFTGPGNTPTDEQVELAKRL